MLVNEASGGHLGLVLVEGGGHGAGKLLLVMIEAKRLAVELSSNIDYNIALAEVSLVAGADNLGDAEVLGVTEQTAGHGLVAVEATAVGADEGVGGGSGDDVVHLEGANVLAYELEYTLTHLC